MRYTSSILPVTITKILHHFCITFAAVLHQFCMRFTPSFTASNRYLRHNRLDRGSWRRVAPVGKARCCKIGVRAALVRCKSDASSVQK